MKTVTVALHSSNGVIAKLIRWQTRSRYSHASVILPDGAWIESRAKEGVHVEPAFEKHKGETVDFFTVEMSDVRYATLRLFLYAQLGKKYDYTMVARFVSRQQESRRSSGKWFCSELVFAAFKQAGIELLRDCEPWEVSPGALARSPLLTPVTTN